MNKKSRKAGGIIEQLGLHNSFLQKILTCTIFLLTPAANMLSTSRFPIGCMIWQHDGILESICATNSIKIFFFSERTGLFTLLLTCSPLLFFPFYLDKLFEVQLPSPLLIYSSTKYSKSNSVFSLLLSWTNYSKSNSSSIFAFLDKTNQSSNSLLSLLSSDEIILSPISFFSLLFLDKVLRSNSNLTKIF